MNAQQLTRRSQLAQGVCLLSVLFLGETWNADRILPNALSPLIWSLLGVVAVVSLVVAVRSGLQARRLRREQEGPR